MRTITTQYPAPMVNRIDSNNEVTSTIRGKGNILKCRNNQFILNGELVKLATEEDFISLHETIGVKYVLTDDHENLIHLSEDIKFSHTISRATGTQVLRYGSNMIIMNMLEDKVTVVRKDRPLEVFGFMENEHRIVEITAELERVMMH